MFEELVARPWIKHSKTDLIEKFLPLTPFKIDADKDKQAKRQSREESEEEEEEMVEENAETEDEEEMDENGNEYI